MPYTASLEDLDKILRIADDPTEVNRVAGEAVQDELRDYLSALDVSHPNKFGSTNRSHYFQDKADTLTLDVDSEAATLRLGTRSARPYSEATSTPKTNC